MHVSSFTILRTWERAGEVVQMFSHPSVTFFGKKVRSWARPETLGSLSSIIHPLQIQLQMLVIGIKSFF